MATNIPVTTAEDSLDEKLKSVHTSIDKDRPVVVFLDKDALDMEDIQHLSDQATHWPEGSVFVLVNGNPEELVKIKPLMTNEEWCGQFIEYMERVTYDMESTHDRGYSYKTVVEAAKKASGLE